MTVLFKDIRGLEKGDPVVVRGVQKGEVSKILLLPDYAEVQLWLNKDVILFADFRIIVESRELIGGKQVFIDPGDSNEPVDFDKVFYGETGGDPIALLNEAKRSLMRVDSVIYQMKTLLERKELGGIIRNLEETTKLANNVFRENSSKIRITLDHFENITRHMVDDSTIFRFGKVVMRMDNMIKSIQGITKQIKKKEGSLGKLIYDEELYNQLIRTSLKLDTLITDFKANPKRYINVSVF
jgi:phospholipid/cholesterol/gamma-HCH transport system substrate-binding protein